MQGGPLIKIERQQKFSYGCKQRHETVQHIPSQKFSEGNRLSKHSGPEQSSQITVINTEQSWRVLQALRQIASDIN